MTDLDPCSILQMTKVAVLLIFLNIFCIFFVLDVFDLENLTKGMYISSYRRPVYLGDCLGRGLLPSE